MLNESCYLSCYTPAVGDYFKFLSVMPLPKATQQTSSILPLLRGVCELKKLVNIPIEQAKDAVCFLQRCGLSLVASAIIYNIVSEKVTR